MNIERVDELPLIVSILERTQLSHRIDKYFSTHGNWTGVSYGKLLVCFLSYVLSTNDHRLSVVEEWFTKRQETMREVLRSPELGRTDLTDDRLGKLLSALSDEVLWNKFENDLNQSLISVHSLDVSEPIRLDASIAQSFQKPDELFKLGYSKQHRADLPQLKIMVGTLDPLAMPLFSMIVEGNRADDGLYEPLERQIIESLDQKGLLFVGDSKMSSRQNRWYLHKSGQYYLSPLSEVQCSKEQIKKYLDSAEEVESLYQDEELRAKVFEKEEIVREEESGGEWLERRIVVYSPTYAKKLEESWEKRKARAKKELGEMMQAKQGKKLPKQLAEVERKVEQILKKNKMKGCLEVKIEEQSEEKKVRQYGGRVGRRESQKRYQIEVNENQEVIQREKTVLGWRVYASNAPQERMSGRKAVECYRKEYRIEQKFNELLNKITALMPIFLQKNERIRALVKVLLLALKFSSLIQFQVRENLKKVNGSINQVYAGNPRRETQKPTVRMILWAFREITLVKMEVDGKIMTKISQLNPLQLKLLELLGLKRDIYENLNQISFSP